MKKVKIDEIKLDPENPNAGDQGRGSRSLDDSVSRYGFRDPGVLDKNNTLVAGNKRTTAAINTLHPDEAVIIDIEPEDVGKPVYVRYQDLDLQDPTTGARALSYVLNRTAQLNLTWDPEKIRKHQDRVDLSGLFTHSELVALGVREDTAEVEEVSTISFLEELQKKWQVEEGNVYLLPRQTGEPHVLYCADSSQEGVWKDVKGRIGDAMLLLTDPPYGASYAEKQKRLNRLTNSDGRLETTISGDKPNEMGDVWESVFRNARQVLSDEASYYIFSQPGGRAGQVRTLLDVLFLCGYGDTHILVWEKDNQPYSQTDYKYPYELIHYGWFDRHDFQAPFEIGHLRYRRPRKNVYHPTQKPVQLLVRLIENSSEPYQTVLDPFCGSGSTLLGCDSVKRRCIGIDCEPQYIAAALERWHVTTEKTPVLATS